ncbi:MAG: cytochrome c1 [Alcaligenaceae bacterium]|nr:cytochrome c1 [Alcaligenaceae bacterium]
MIKKFLGALILMFAVSGPAMSASAGYAWDRAPERITDLAALQNGAKLFVNYCLNCHSASSLRYNKLTDLGLTQKEIEENLLFTGDKVGDLMHVAMRPADAKLWLGVAPPDLSVMARAKAANLGQPGTDYIYTYLRTFYRDVTTPLGWNNLVFPNAGMPHVFWEQSGPTELTTVEVHPVEKDGQVQWFKTTTVVDSDGFSSVVSDEPLADYKGHASIEHNLKYLDSAKEVEFSNNMADLSAFLGWMSEPDQQFRKQLGTWVLLFLAVFFVIAWRLNKSYWKHVK